MMYLPFRFYRCLTVLFCCSLLLVRGAHAQTNRSTYKLGPGDILSVTVDKHPEFSVGQVTVTPSGLVSLPVVDAVKVTGKSLEQLESEITSGLKKRLLRPRVTVTLVKARPQQVFVLGPVARPGSYEMQPGWRISEILAIAGT